MADYHIKLFSFLNIPAPGAGKCTDKLRTSIIIDSGADKEEVINLAKANQKITNYLENNEIIKIIFIKDRLLNIVIKQKK